MGSYKNSVTVAVLRDGSAENGQYNIETNVSALEKSYEWDKETTSQNLIWEEEELTLGIYDTNTHSYLVPGTGFNPVITAYYADGTELTGVTAAINKIQGQSSQSKTEDISTITIVTEDKITVTLTENIAGLVSVTNTTGGGSVKIDLDNCTYNNNILTIEKTGISIATSINVVYKYLVWEDLSNIWQNSNNTVYTFNLSVFTDYNAYRCKEHPSAESIVDPEMIVFNKLQEQMVGQNINLGFTLYNGSTQTQKIDLLVIPVTFILNPNYAKFSLNARSIEASIDSKAATFDTSGLHIQNAGFDINSEYTEWRYQEECNAVESNNNILVTTTYKILKLVSVEIKNGATIDLNDCTISSSDLKQFIIVNHTFESGMIVIVNYVYEDHTSEGRSGETSVDYKEKVFYYDVNSNELYVKGAITATSGSFTGEVNATSGTFQGDIKASNLVTSSGTIGGITINSTGLTSGENGFSINSDGTIEADTITLGRGAAIKDYLQLGSTSTVKIWNPDATDNTGHLVLETTNTTLNRDGLLKLGSLIFDGSSSTISGDSWSITSDKATFNNAVIRGKIESSVFDVGSTQSVGGQMIFRPSYKVKTATLNDDTQILTIELEDEIDADQPSDRYFYLVGYHNLITQSIKPITASKTILTFSNITGDINNITGIVDFGENNSINYIGINGSEDSGTLPAMSLVMDSITRTASSTTTVHNLFLGNFRYLEGYETILDGYGLYADNVYLRGSLVTEIVSGSKYAGINTKSGINATQFSTDDTSSVVFWAGSESLETDDIKNAPFQVTQEGSVYATRGVFKGSVISDSVISKSTITTAKIEGSGDGSYALQFINANKGLGFFNNTTDPSTLIFGIDSVGLTDGSIDEANKRIYFIDLSDNNIKYSGNQYLTYSSNSLPQLDIHDNEVSAFSKGINDKILYYGALEFSASDLKLKYNTITLMALTQDIVTLKENVQIDKKFSLGDHMEYRLHSEDVRYYDLYITSA